jgi:hypothetical protein
LPRPTITLSAAAVCAITCSRSASRAPNTLCVQHANAQQTLTWPHRPRAHLSRCLSCACSNGVAYLPNCAI